MNGTHFAPKNRKEDGCLFHPLTDADLPLIWERQQKLTALSSEFDAFRLYAWLHYDRTQVAYWRNQFALRFSLRGEASCYIAPYETEDVTSLLEALKAYELKQGGELLRFLCVEKESCRLPNGFTATPRRDLYDYVYRAEDLIAMPGRDYAAKRNQIAQFKRKYQWRFAPLTPDNAADCFAVLETWSEGHEGAALADERIAIERMVHCPYTLGQCGGILYADGQPVAFAIGSHPRPRLLDVVAEKALPGYTGVYSVIIQAFAEYAHAQSPFDFINREEDMGLENLRNAKLQLKPALLVEKTLLTYPL